MEDKVRVWRKQSERLWVWGERGRTRMNVQGTEKSSRWR